MLRHISYFLNHDKKQNEVNHLLFPVTRIVTNSFKPFPESKYQNLQKVLFRHCSIGNHKMLLLCFKAESPLKSKDCGNNRPSNIISMMDGQGWFWHQPVVSTKTNSLWVTPLPHTRLNCPNYFRNQKKWVDNWGYFSVC